MLNKNRAIISGRIATIKNGKRIITAYKSGEPLQGFIPDNDAPPFTGFVRGWFRSTGKHSQ